LESVGQNQTGEKGFAMVERGESSRVEGQKTRGGKKAPNPRKEKFSEISLGFQWERKAVASKKEEKETPRTDMVRNKGRKKTVAEGSDTKTIRGVDTEKNCVVRYRGKASSNDEKEGRGRPPREVRGGRDLTKGKKQYT